MRIIRQPAVGMPCDVYHVIDETGGAHRPDLPDAADAVREGGGGGLFAYPVAERLAALREEDLRACALGYRAGNLLKTARMIAGCEVDLEAVQAMPDDEARAELCKLAGVGVEGGELRAAVRV